MTTITINVEVSPMMAALLERLERENPDSYQAMISAILSQRSNPKTLEEIMRDISQQAENNGLTAEALADILDSDDVQ